jgi:UDP-N-acetylmuramyl pentapeptide phosphotransferase/UDP-N-acetylglucosamine-1-phosphate transferase
MIEWWPLGVSAACAGMLMPVAIRARSIGHDETDGVQKLHLVPTSRLGGLVVAAAYLAALAVAVGVGRVASADALPMVLAALPVVLVGLWEDLTRRVRPRHRVLAAVVSAVLASAYAGGIVARLDLPVIDGWLQHLWLVLPLTWFMVAGACNAINLIDGVNGLAGGTALMMFAGIAMAAGGSGDAQTLVQALAMMGALVGFLAWNYPRGRVFLGDAGAYFVGFVYAELSISLVARNDGISAWFVIVLAAYPIVETLFSIYRRSVVRRTASMAPDALHLHSLIYRRVTRRIERYLPDGDRHHANARVAPRLWTHGALCLALAMVFRENTPALMTSLVAYAGLYVGTYRALVRFRSRRIPRVGIRPRIARSEA